MKKTPLTCPHCSNQDKSLLSWDGRGNGIHYYWCLVCSKNFEVKSDEQLPEGTVKRDH